MYAMPKTAMKFQSHPCFFLEIVTRENVVQSLNPLPFVMAMANCVAWTTYAFLLEDWYLVIPNSVGCLIAAFLFLTSHGLGMPDRKARDQLSLACMVLTVLLFVVSILERMVITSLEAKKQMWGYTGVFVCSLCELRNVLHSLLLQLLENPPFDHLKTAPIVNALACCREFVMH
jgi:hypothetical protein